MSQGNKKKKGGGKNKGKKKVEEEQKEPVEEEKVEEKQEEEKVEEKKEEEEEEKKAPEIALGEESPDVRSLLERIPVKKPEASGGWGWSSWGLPEVSLETLSDGFNSVVNETRSVMGELETMASATLESTLAQASTFAEQMEVALGLADDRAGFGKFFIENGGPALTADLKELAARSADAVASMELSEEDEAHLKELVEAYRNDEISFDDEGDAGEDSVAEVPGVDTSSVVECIKSHNLVLVDSHQKLMADLKKCGGDGHSEEERDAAVARIAIESKHRMQQLFSLGVFEILKRSFLLIGDQADKLSEISREVGQAIETGSAEAGPRDSYRPLTEQLETLRTLRKFLRQKLWAFQKNYASMMRSIPDLMEDVSQTEEMLAAMRQLTIVTQSEIVLDTETALEVVDNCLELMDYELMLAMAVK